ncbi:MAG: [FeFe] hydrogenase H-cluster radical SAM maturase HydG [Spirochaetaceae bacterium]|jgi:2-iminoacetate synthase|nr:[FeFe] hydrogenase H-cluster radical SAM maturase HydG [Spirochaetaceae bacterium]
MFIEKEYINSVLEQAKDTDDNEIEAILNRAEHSRGLNHTDIAALLQTTKPEHITRIFSIANNIKQQIYGNRIVLFAPLYVSDYCVNQCAYCGYNCGNSFNRRKLTMDEIRREVLILEQMGHKRLALEAGEDDDRCSIDYILECIHTIYDMKCNNGEIRRLNVNIAATTTENYRKLKDAEIGTYILFQETYDQDVYNRMHISGPKKDFAYHLEAFDRAMEGGIDDVGGGVLFGLADPFFEVIGLMIHNEHLEKKFGAGFHTISVPRLCKSGTININAFPHLVNDQVFEKITAVIRLAVPFTGMILSTREGHTMRKKLLKLGISQLSAGSSTEVGGYSRREEGRSNPQFEVNDDRDATAIIGELMDDGYIPSFCTACYRSGRTGDRFMELAKSGQIKDVCLPNALLTLREYAEDYGNDSFKEKAKAAILREYPHISNDRIRKLTVENVEKIGAGARDLYL